MQRYRMTETIDKKKEFYADMLLLLVTVIWGFSYLAVHMCILETGTLGLNAYRFISAGILTAIIFNKRMRHIDRETWKWSFYVGITLCVTYALTNLSIRYTSTPNAAFLCAMGVIFVPIFEFVFMHRKQPPKLLVAIVLSVIGIAFLTLTGGGRLPKTHVFGDICGILTAIVYAVNMIATETAVQKKKMDAVQIGVLSMIWTGVVILFISLAIHDIGIPTSRSAIMAVVFLALFCTAFSFIAIPVAQRHTPASHEGIIFSLEPVFASIVAVFAENLVPTGLQLAGEIIMITAFLVLEVNPVKKTDREI